MRDDSSSDPLQRPAAQPAGDDDDAALVARVRARVLGAVAAEAKSPYTTVRAGEDGWETVAPGVQRKVLSAQAQGQPSLWRLAPGGRVPGHRHDADEECLVLEGTVRIGRDLVLHAGDYHLAPRGSDHPQVSSDDGALVYLRGAPPAGGARTPVPEAP